MGFRDQADVPGCHLEAFLNTVFSEIICVHATFPPWGPRPALFCFVWRSIAGDKSTGPCIQKVSTPLLSYKPSPGNQILSIQKSFEKYQDLEDP